MQIPIVVWAALLELEGAAVVDVAGVAVVGVTEVEVIGCAVDVAGRVLDVVGQTTVVDVAVGQPLPKMPRMQMPVLVGAEVELEAAVDVVLMLVVATDTVVEVVVGLTDVTTTVEDAEVTMVVE